MILIVIFMRLLTHFRSMLPFYTPKNFFFMFSGDIEIIWVNIVWVNCVEEVCDR